MSLQTDAYLPGSPPEESDPREIAVMGSRFDGVARAMLNTLLRSARTGVLAVAHDFSCCVLTAEDELLAWAESMPIHVLSGPDLMARHMREAHPEMRRGDAYLNNSPYHGCSHAADWSILVPVFDAEGVHRLTVMAKAHQGDCGNAEPTTYSFSPRDVYEEGALIFPSFKVQEDHRDNEDFVRMCKLRIRVAEQWWGDYMALVGAARIGERRLEQLLAEVGVEAVERYSRAWLGHSERRMIEAIGRLPAGTTSAVSVHDPMPVVPDGVPISVTVSVDPDAGRIAIDLRDNADCLPCGINLSEACARTAAMIGVFMGVAQHVPPNAGSFRRIDVLLRENCCVGIPRHPASCSTATSDLMDRVANATLRCFAQLGDGLGMAEFGYPQAPAGAVLSGVDPRDGEPFINQLCLAITAGAAGPTCDGWLTAYNVGVAGMLYRDSVEIDELKHPIIVHEQRILADSEGAGRTCGAPSAVVEYGPVGCSIELMTNSDGGVNPARGARGGADGAPSRQFRRTAADELEPLPGFHRIRLEDGETVVSVSSGGAGYGSPLARDPELVERDLRRGWIAGERARSIYGVVFTGSGDVDHEATRALRAELEGGDAAA